MTTNATPQVTIRLDDEHRAMAADLRAALASRVLPNVSLADVIRAAIRSLHSSLVAAPTVATQATSLGAAA